MLHYTYRHWWMILNYDEFWITDDEFWILYQYLLNDYDNWEWIMNNWLWYWIMNNWWIMNRVSISTSIYQEELSSIYDIYIYTHMHIILEYIGSMIMVYLGNYIIMLYWIYGNILLDMCITFGNVDI